MTQVPSIVLILGAVALMIMKYAGPESHAVLNNEQLA
jgi:hypothetical protein